MMPSLAWQTQVSDLPWAGRHLVPVGTAEVRGIVISSRRESRETARTDIAIMYSFFDFGAKVKSSANCFCLYSIVLQL